MPGWGFWRGRVAQGSIRSPRTFSVLPAQGPGGPRGAAGPSGLPFLTTAVSLGQAGYLCHFTDGETGFREVGYFENHLSNMAPEFTSPTLIGSPRFLANPLRGKAGVGVWGPAPAGRSPGGHSRLAQVRLRPGSQHLRGGPAFPLPQLSSRKHWAGSQGESDAILPGGPGEYDEG